MNTDSLSPETKFWHDQDLPHLEIRFSRYNAVSFSKHAHESFSISLIEKGCSSFFHRGGNHLMGAGEIAVVPMGEVHACNPQAGSEWIYKMFYIDVEWMLQTASEVLRLGPNLPHFSSLIIRDSDLAERLRHIYGLVESKASRLQKECCFLSAITSFFLKHAEGHRKSDNFPIERRAVKLIKEFIEENYAENISLKQLSDLTGLSAYHLLRVFNSAVGSPPHKYLIWKRLHKARGMLSKGFPIVEVALQSGFTDQSHFTNLFKRTTGVTPRQYRMAQLITP